MFVGKLGTPSCSSYEHFHVYLAYRRQTGTVVTRQTYDRAPCLTNHRRHTFQGVSITSGDITVTETSSSPVELLSL